MYRRITCICYGGQHNSDLLGISANLQISIIPYIYNIVSTVLLCKKLNTLNLQYLKYDSQH